MTYEWAPKFITKMVQVYCFGAKNALILGYFHFL